MVGANTQRGIGQFGIPKSKRRKKWRRGRKTGQDEFLNNKLAKKSRSQIRRMAPVPKSTPCRPMSLGQNRHILAKPHQNLMRKLLQNRRKSPTHTHTKAGKSPLAAPGPTPIHRISHRRMINLKPRPSPPVEVLPKSPAPPTQAPASNFCTPSPADFMDDPRPLQALAAAGHPQSQADRIGRQEIENRRSVATKCV